uniref:alpha-glucosidase n=1 Tax=Trichuris muris TaxID=70415 RepID=A0A5S6QWN4_TRIMR
MTQSTHGQVNEGRREWWKETIIYQIYPRSFKDTSGNGVGDINGIREKLDYFEWLGVKALWICPVYCSPMVDFGYDISDHRSVDPLFGTNEELQLLIKEMHARDMYLIMDIVPNHTSDKHPWFVASCKGEEKFADFYIWKDGIKQESGALQPPNNWESVTGGSAWQWCEQRGQFYLHTFLKEQPDLNYRNSDVKSEMEEIFLHWLKIGVDGFRIDAVIYIMKDEEFRDNPVVLDKESAADETHWQPGMLTIPTYNVDQKETYELVESWTKLFRSFGDKHNKHILSMTEGYTDLDHVINYYNSGVTFPLNFSLVGWKAESEADELIEAIAKWQVKKPKGKWSSWVMGNHDQKRIASRLGGSCFTNVANALLLLLPGTAICYYGDELGMNDVEVPPEAVKDPYAIRHIAGDPDAPQTGRDPCRAPLPWTSTEQYAGFTSCQEGPWLPMPDHPQALSVETQRSTVGSCLNSFKALLELRRLPTFALSSDNVKIIICPEETVLVFSRTLHGFPTFLIVLNLAASGTEPVNVNLSSVDEEVPYAEVVYDSLTFRLFRSIIPLRSVTLGSPHVMVLKFMPSGRRKRAHSASSSERDVNDQSDAKMRYSGSKEQDA